ncbi:hypothetical protein PU634_08000 [Oceanimonas pelagia]|uniref:DUF6701 domain-containing protein n=1 Tax=Oceanimonas pelagia TaxID=3028314 RepID=A0AA50QDH3_9GAMM|nr:DUF6701 domain-containing protein [Oceanimonas pelagia]WMC12292.1 hypothetical protein PU634_08000 [Oceanimonas pelagia]
MINRNWIFLIALIPLLSYAGKKGEVDHYRLDYNPDEEVMTLLSCEDESCTNLYKSNKTKVKITKDNNNEGNEIYFKNVSNGKDSEAYNANEGTCYPLRLSLKGKSTTPQPSREPGLKCYIKGVLNPSCKFCSDGDSEDDDRPEDISVDMDLVGYVGFSSEEAGIRIDNEEINGLSLIIENVKGEDDNKNVELRDQSGKLLKKGDKFTFPNTLYYNRVGEIEFDLKEIDGEGQKVHIKLDLIYVPYKLAWVTEPAEVFCYDANGFEYNIHENTCPVIGKAGEKLSLKLQAYDADGIAIKNQNVDDLEIEIDCKEDDEPGCIKIRELNAGLNLIREFEQTEIKFDDQGVVVFKTDSEDEGEGYIKNVALIEAYVSPTCADDPDDDCALLINGDTAILGRTVPASLEVIETHSGDIDGDVVYAGKPGVEFLTKPSFTLVGLDVNGKELPSYSGEFAGGLKGNTSLELSDDLDVGVVVPTFAENEAGKHVISFDTSKIKFNKITPFPETDLDLPVNLTITNHDETRGTAAQTTLGNTQDPEDKDTLRFGFITLMDTEIKVGEAGTMASTLHYYGDDLNSLKEDGDTDYSLSDGDLPKGSLPDGTSFPGLSVKSGNKKVIDVAPYSSEQKNIEVTIENLPAWLKPADQEKAGELTNPSAMLDILSNPRLRASDRTFNRREVTR